MSSLGRRALTGATALAVCAAPALAVPGAATAAVSTDAPVVINEVYGGGGNSGALYTHDFVELYNTTDAAISLDGWTVQYASSAGTNWSGSNDANITPLTGSIEPGQHYLIQMAQGAGGSLALPDPDVIGSTAMAAANGNVALVSSTTALDCAATACAVHEDVVDLVAYGSGAAYAGSGAAPATANAQSVSRDHLSTNTGDNAADFAISEPPTPGAPIPEPGEAPEPEPATIPEIQGTGAVSPLVGDLVTVRGAVTASYPTGGYFGFVIQTPGTGGQLDEYHEASHGLFVYQRTGPVVPVVGDHVEVTGTVAEFNGLTQVVVEDGSGVEVLDEEVEQPTPITGMEWPRTDAERERIESMLFEPYGTYTVTNTFQTNQFGEVGLAFGDTPLLQPTDNARPLSDEALAIEADNDARRVVLDDASSVNFLSSANSGLTPPYLSLENPVRVGAEVIFPDPVIVDYRNNSWKFQPTYHLTADVPVEERPHFENTRTAAPDEERLGDGSVRISAFNVLNYFPTLGIDDPACVPFTDRAGNGVTVRTGCPQRGAWDEAAFERQESKIVDAINTLDADVLGLIEMENSVVLGNDVDESFETLVAALNADAGEERWAYIASSDEMPSAEVMDVITNGIIYQPELVTPVGEMRVLGELSGPGDVYSNAREPIGQAFESVDGGEPFFVVVNHFKSKGSGSGENADQGDGQAASNPDRIRQATALVDWLDEVLEDYDHLSEAMDTFVIGDLNSYSYEDPMQVFYEAGFVNGKLWMAEQGFDPQWSYSFSGLSGSLDHILVSSSTVEEDRVTGVDIWNINAPESVALEYSRYNYHGTLFYEEGPFRSSDHDPIMVAFDPRAPEDPVDPGPVDPGPVDPGPVDPGEPGEPRTFSDVPVTHPFYEQITWASAYGIAQGYDDGTFRPSVRVSRQAMAAFVYRLHEGGEDGAPAPACTTAPFTDVPVSHPFCGEIAWMKDTGLSTGYADGTYQPSRGVSRQAMAAFLFRMLNEEDTQAPACRTQPFNDVATNHPFCGEIRWLAEREIVRGYDSGDYQPERRVSRQAMTAFLYNVWEATTE